MKYFGVFLIFLFVVLGCTNKKTCKVDEESELFIQAQLSLIDDTAKNNHLFSGNVYRAVSFFGELTHIESTAHFGDVSQYGKYSDFKKDKNKWNAWYEENKCNLSIDSVKVIYAGVIKSTPWIGTPTEEGINDK